MPTTAPVDAPPRSSRRKQVAAGLGVAVILGVDALMDMARTSVNLIGNCLATAVMARWEGELGTESMPVIDALAGEPIRMPPAPLNEQV